MLGEAEGDLVEVVGTDFGVLFTGFLTLLCFCHSALHGGCQVALVAFGGSGDAVATSVGGLELAGGLVEVHQMAVEFGSVDAAELHLVTYAYTAGAAHTGAVDHHAVEAHDGGQVVFLCGEANELHHRQGTDGHTMAVLHAFGAELVDLGGDETLFAVAAIVGHDVQVVAHGTQLVLIEEQVFGAGANDDIGGDALTESPFHLWKHRRDTHTTGHEEQPLQLAFRMLLYQLTWPSQGTHDGIKVVAFLHLGQLACGFANHLEDDDHRLALVYDVADGERYALAVLVGNDDNELARLAAERYPWGMDLHPVNLVAVEQPLADDFVHVVVKFFAKVQIIYGMAK